LVYFMTHRNFGRWYITNEEGRLGSASNVIAFVNSEVKSPNLLERDAIWSERSSPRKGKFNANDNIVFSGDCVKEPKHPNWQEAKTMNGAGCPTDETYRTVKNEDYAIVHWTDPVEAHQEHEIVYQSGDTTPGSRFKVGKTGVVYTVRSAGRIIRTCDFVITVEDRDPPIFECPNDVFVEIEAARNDAVANWDVPIAVDAVEGKVKVKQIKGPTPGTTLKKGIHRIIYEAADSSNSARCVFRIRVQDKIPPIVIGCPKDLTIEAYEANNWSAHPKWNEPSGNDNVDGKKVTVTQVAGLQPGEAFTVAVNDEENTSTQIYHIQDRSGNIATCQFQIKLRKSHASVKGEDFHGQLDTDSPQEPGMPSLNSGEQQRPPKFDQLIREEQSSKIQKMIANAKDRQRLMQGLTSGGHVSPEHLERLKNMKLEEQDVSPRMRTLPEESNTSWLWTLFKAATIAIPLVGLGGGIVLYFTGYLFAPKGKRVPSHSNLANLNVTPSWMKTKSEDKLRRRRV